jgi:hypothetical protein
MYEVTIGVNSRKKPGKTKERHWRLSPFSARTLKYCHFGFGVLVMEGFTDCQCGFQVLVIETFGDLSV